MSLERRIKVCETILDKAGKFNELSKSPLSTEMLTPSPVPNDTLGP